MKAPEATRATTPPGSQVYCRDCDARLLDPDRPRCPECLSERRVTYTGGTFTAHVWRPWDSASLTLAGVLYAIVLAAVFYALGSQPWGIRVAMAGVTLVILALALVPYRDPTIRAMRWLLERGKPGPVAKP